MASGKIDPLLFHHHRLVILAVKLELKHAALLPVTHEPQYVAV